MIENRCKIIYNKCNSIINQSKSIISLCNYIYTQCKWIKDIINRKSRLPKAQYERFCGELGVYGWQSRFVI